MGGGLESKYDTGGLRYNPAQGRRIRSPALQNQSFSEQKGPFLSASLLLVNLSLELFQHVTPAGFMQGRYIVKRSFIRN